MSSTTESHVRTAISLTSIMFERIQHDVLVIIGSGGISTAISRRLSNGRHTCFVDIQTSNAVSNASTRSENGNSISHHQVDLTSHESVKELANEISSLGRIDAIVMTAPGVSPLSSTPEQIFKTDLLGVAYVIDAFIPLVSPRTSFVCIASTAANVATHFTPLSRDLEIHLASAPIEDLLDHPELDIEDEGPQAARRAYAIAKRGNQLRVEGNAVAYGRMGARINSVSPGMILMKMVKEEAEDGPSGPGFQGLIDRSVMGKAGTVEDVANVVAFLVGYESHYITGIDIVVDGGTLAGRKWSS